MSTASSIYYVAKTYISYSLNPGFTEKRYYKIFWMSQNLEVGGSKKDQKSTSLPRQLHWQNLSDVTILELWSAFKGLQLPGEALDVNSVQSISAPSCAVNTYPLPQPCNMCVSGAAFGQLREQCEQYRSWFSKYQTYAFWSLMASPNMEA
jgi:hypothetical protein